MEDARQSNPSSDQLHSQPFPIVAPGAPRSPSQSGVSLVLYLAASFKVGAYLTEFILVF